MVIVKTDMTIEEARALEQALITAFTLDALNNIYNSIAKAKWDQFSEEIMRIEKLWSSALE